MMTSSNETFPRYWPFVRGIHRSPVNFPHKGQWRGALMYSLICTRINGWGNNGDASELRYRVTPDHVLTGTRAPPVSIWRRYKDKELVRPAYLYNRNPILGRHIILRRSPAVFHDDVIKWKHFPRYRPFVRGIHRSLVNCPHKGK